MRTNFLWAKLILTMLIISSVSFIYADCKLMGLIGLNGKSLSQTSEPNIWNNFTGPCIDKLKDMGRGGNPAPVYPNYNPNGWAFITYNEETPTVSYDERNSIANDDAYTSDDFDSAVIQIQNVMEPRIILGHIRRATNPNTQSMPDPHPFRFNLNGREFTFIHNGGVNISAVEALIGTAWLNEHPYHLYNGYKIDSEVYFYWIMKNIEEQNGDVLKGLKNALYAMTLSSHSCLNFVLSDGTDLYAYRYMFSDDDEHELAYFYDTTDEELNYNYCGVMSIFPNGENPNGPDWTDNIDTPNNIQTHVMERNELVYISSTGNIVRFPKFGDRTLDVASYHQKRDFHKGYNYVGLPILPINTQTQSVAVSPLLDYYLQTANGELQRIYSNNVIVTEREDEFTWSHPEFALGMTSLYKMEFEDNSPSIHTALGATATSITIANAPIYPSNASVLYDIVANQPYWVSYTLLPTQNVKDAFGDSWLNVKSVRAEDWLYIQGPWPSIGKSEGPTVCYPISTYWWGGKNVNFGKGYVVTFNENMDHFAWSRPYTAEPPSPERQKPEFFEWEDAPEYLVVDIVEVEGQSTILEVGAFQGENCIGAVKVDKLPCQLLIYPKYEDPNPITFQIIYKAKSAPQLCSNYQVFQPELSDYFTDKIIPEQNTNYIVKLTSDTPSQNVSAIKPLVSVSSYPNPFNPQTAISFALKYDSDVQISVYNIKGQLVKDFGKLNYKSGINRLKWNGKDNQNKAVTGGIYFVKVDSGKNMLTHKMVMLK